MIATKAEALQYLKDHHVIELDPLCDACGEGHMSLKTPTQFRCKRFSCRHTRSVFQGTMFAGGSRTMDCHDVLQMAYYWLAGGTFSTIQAQTGKSAPTVTRWVRIFKRVLQLDFDTEDHMIGGPGIVVEIDESKFGKRTKED